MVIRSSRLVACAIIALVVAAPRLLAAQAPASASDRILALLATGDRAIARGTSDVAMAQGSVTARWLEDGAEMRGEFVHMELLARRADTWVIVRTLGARVR
jgi:hypothetical protein